VGMTGRARRRPRSEGGAGPSLSRWLPAAAATSLFRASVPRSDLNPSSSVRFRSVRVPCVRSGSEKDDPDVPGMGVPIDLGGPLPARSAPRLAGAGSPYPRTTHGIYPISRRTVNLDRDGDCGGRSRRPSPLPRKIPSTPGGGSILGFPSGLPCRAGASRVFCRILNGRGSGGRCRFRVRIGTGQGC
jgi:hypothetical protein